MENIQRWSANVLPDKFVYGTKSGEFLDLLKIEKGPLEELGLMNQRDMSAFVKNADVPRTQEMVARPQGGEVRCRLEGAQMAIGQRLDVKQSTPPFDGGKALVGA